MYAETGGPRPVTKKAGQLNRRSRDPKGRAEGAARDAPAARTKTPTPASASSSSTPSTPKYGRLHPVCRRCGHCVLRGRHDDDASDLEERENQGDGEN